MLNIFMRMYYHITDIHMLQIVTLTVKSYLMSLICKQLLWKSHYVLLVML
jgi:hypothetical protein